MPHPSVSGELTLYLELVADNRADVPVEHLTFEQQVSFVLDELADESESDSGGLFLI
ncbi:hypothetical protein [Haloquadratum walsbyi]|jgi:hypothetical protein|uniref:Uncharacterized protein n=1 Tax=Haloquadratum walsbyi J07HQW2 TaxID=1238425 RepID=U1NBY3_9EURY|nr:hypothetical protein [Haloquadratum walsbyi]ERG94188.1 MAG: hypothetical protein J07HQW2_00622 [Haloquadratum walsbyi J07HQW2]